jgi:hypothetical protein
MNVDTFTNNPSLKWWFIVAVPLMVCVLILWYILKHTLARRHQDMILRRGAYENLYQELSSNYPRLWSRNGPRDTVVPEGYFSKFKWRLLTSWYAPSKTIARRTYDPTDVELGAWGRLKRYLVRRWLGDIRVARGSTELDTELGEVGPDGDLGTVNELISFSQPIATAAAEPVAATVGAMLSRAKSSRRGKSHSRSHSSSPRLTEERPGSAGKQASGSGIMIDERSSNDGNEASEAEPSDDGMDDQKKSSQSKRRSRGLSERLRLPGTSGESSPSQFSGAYISSGLGM